jgi:hypothetical protein
MFIRHSRNVIPLALAGILGGSWLSPALAIEQPRRGSDRLWAESRDLPLVENAPDLNKPLTRSDFIISTAYFYQQMFEFESARAGELERLCLDFEEKERYLLDRIAGSNGDGPGSLRYEVARAIAMAKQAVEQAEKRAEKRTTEPKNRSKQSEVPAWESAPYNGNFDLYRLQEEFGLDMRLADGSFQLDQPLIQGDYLDYMRQLEAMYGRELFDGNSFFTTDPIEFVLEDRDIIKTEQFFSEIFDALGLVRSRLTELRALTRALNGKQATSAQTAGQKSAVVQTSAIRSVVEIPDLTPADPAYEALDSLMWRSDEFVRELLRADGRFDGQTVLTRDEFVRYSLDLIESPGTGFLLAIGCGFNSSDHILDIQRSSSPMVDELYQMVRELDVAIADVTWAGN